MITILGNATGPNGVSSLTYSLNGGAEESLSLGPNRERLAQTGDFIIELPYLSTPIGRNQLRLTAADAFGATGSVTVDIDNHAGPIWPLPYQIDWSSTENINDVAQVSDGLWSIQDGSVRTSIPSYDRLINIGDTSWQ
ncbi:MAG: hypothetical protein FWC56_04470, partial [Phycisphaerae bacterium]|nr:hypothetical protein [Phycisphaerae bacterium]